jgi:Ca-activated chloride channel family protein
MFKTIENLWILAAGGLWLAALLWCLVRDIRRRRAAFADVLILERIVGHKPTRRPFIKWAGLIMAFFLMAVALARPIGGVYEEAVSGSGLDLVVLFDVSQSMLARDISGHSRLDIGKALIEQLIGGLRQDRVGLVAFAGDTMIQCPLTQDKNTFLTFLQRLDPSLLTKQGTSLAGALETGIDRFDLTASQSRVLVLVSDGEDRDPERLKKALDEARRKNITIFTVGIGSEDGAPIPIGRNIWGEFQYKTYQGRQVVTRLEDKTLKDVAKSGNGTYFRAADGKSAVRVAESLHSLKRVAVTSGTVTMTREWFPLPALAAFLILLVEWMISERIPYEREKDHWLKRL